MDDPRPMFALALDQLDQLAVRIGPQQLRLPTPCAGLDVAALLRHLLAGLGWLGRLGANGAAERLPAGARARAPAQGSALPAAWVAQRQRYERIWSDRALLDRTLVSPWTAAPGRVVLACLVPEFVMHGWDLAVALGRVDTGSDRGSDTGSEELARFSLDLVRRCVPASPRPVGGPFGAVVPVPADAPAAIRLAGWLGRAVSP